MQTPAEHTKVSQIQTTETIYLREKAITNPQTNKVPSAWEPE